MKLSGFFGLGKALLIVVDIHLYCELVNDHFVNVLDDDLGKNLSSSSDLSLYDDLSLN